MWDVWLIIVANWLPRRLVLYVVYRVVNHCRLRYECRYGLTTITASDLISDWREVLAGDVREVRK